MSAYKEHDNYKIKDRQERNAKKLGVEIRPSKNKMKKLDVFKEIDGEDFKISEIGGYYQDGTPYGDYATYLQTKKDRYGKDVDADERRKRYLVRHEHEKKKKRYTATFEGGKEKKIEIGTPSFYADKILWA